MVSVQWMITLCKGAIVELTKKPVERQALGHPFYRFFVGEGYLLNLWGAGPCGRPGGQAQGLVPTPQY